MSYISRMARRAEMRHGFPPALPHYHNFDVKPWKASDDMLKWKSDCMDNPGGKHPHVLVIVGPPRCGKTEWAMSFGRPIEMGPRWNLDVLLKKDYTHLVLNDIHKTFLYLREMASGQILKKVNGKYKRGRIVNFDKPVIFTFDQDNEVWNDKKFRGYLLKSRAVIVETSEKLF